MSSFIILPFFQDLISLLKGKNTITWEISPTSEVKKRCDTLERCACLSIDLLHTDEKPCPLIMQEVSFDNEITSRRLGNVVNKSIN